MISRPYSFFQVVDVSEGKTLTLRDLFLNQPHVVIEKQASRPEIKGEILFTRVISLDGISVMTGCMTVLIPSLYHPSLIDFRKELAENEEGPLTPEFLMEYEFELRERFFEILQDIKNPRLPKLQNTDGDRLAPVKLKYHLNCSPMEAFDRLKSLAQGIDDEELLRDSERDPEGELKRIHFSWLKKGNPKNPGWENTVMGTIEINENQMNVEVNSVNRSEAIKWDSWVDSPVPALGNLTPREAVNDPVGREKLDGLFLHFESMNRSQGIHEFSPDIAKLKKILGI